MFCPFCGVKNDRGEKDCFICNRKLPRVEGEILSAPNSAARVPPPNGQRAASLAPGARILNRLLALVLDLLFVGAVLLIAGAAIWSRGDQLIRDIDSRALATTVAVATLLLIFVYNWVSEQAFGATIGKAFTNIRVIRRERPLSRGARAGVMAFWVVAVGAAVWGAFELCPQWFVR